MKYEKLWSKFKLNGKTVKNRIVMSPMGDNMANADGSISDQLREYYVRRAAGGTGIIIPGVFSVEYPRGKTESCQPRIDKMQYINGVARMAHEIHRYGALLIPQLHHAGATTDIDTTEGVKPLAISMNLESTTNAGAHISSYGADTPDVHIASTEDLKELERKFIQAAVYAKMANCDGIELHGAHTYLFGQLLTPAINNRTDEYGGSVENRARFEVNIVKGIREACGPDFIIGTRLPVHYSEADSLTDEDCIKTAQMLEEAGLDFIDVSLGVTTVGSNYQETEAYEEGDRVFLTEKIRPHVNIPVFAMGNIKSPEVAEKILADDRADFICMGRQLIADPDWANKVKKGQADQVRKCISCGKGCIGELSQSRFITCALNPEAGYEDIYKRIPASKKAKKVIIVGGGVAGMQAAITATERGHEAIILEKSGALGGQVDIASKGPNKFRVIPWVKEWFVGEVERQGIEVRLNCEATEEMILNEKPDAVFVATGSLPFNPPIAGVDGTIAAWDVLNETVAMPEGKKAIILGGGVVGCEVAEMLADKGNQTTVIEMTPNIAVGLAPLHRMDLLTAFAANENITVLTEAKVCAIDGNKVTYMSNGETTTIVGDFIVSAFGQKPVGVNLAESLEEKGIDVTILGDAKAPGSFMTATRTAYDAAVTL